MISKLKSQNIKKERCIVGHTLKFFSWSWCTYSCTFYPFSFLELFICRKPKNRNLPLLLIFIISSLTQYTPDETSMYMQLSHENCSPVIVVVHPFTNDIKIWSHNNVWKSMHIILAGFEFNFMLLNYNIYKQHLNIAPSKRFRYAFCLLLVFLCTRKI